MQKETEDDVSEQCYCTCQSNSIGDIIDENLTLARHIITELCHGYWLVHCKVECLTVSEPKRICK